MSRHPVLTRVAVFVLAALTTLIMLRGCEAFAAEPAVKLPTEIRAKPGRLLRLQAETTNKHVRWFLSNPDDADLIPIAAEKAAIFCSPTVGRYRVFCYTAAGDVPSEPAVCVVIVGEAPDPGPKPPPSPDPPEPSDPFAKALQAAYAADAAPDKAKRRDQLASLYRYAANLVSGESEIDTVGKLYDVLRDAGKILVGDQVLPGVRRAIAEELSKVLPTSPSAPLDKATRERCASQFTRVAKALESVR